MKFAVCVTFKIKPDSWHQFLELMKANAKASLSKEQECLHFDVCVDEAEPCVVFLYEVYSSPDAFKHHLETQHFMDFDSAVSNMIEKKEVATYSTVY